MRSHLFSTPRTVNPDFSRAPANVSTPARSASFSAELDAAEPDAKEQADRVSSIA